VLDVGNPELALRPAAPEFRSMFDDEVKIQGSVPVGRDRTRLLPLRNGVKVRCRPA